VRQSLEALDWLRAQGCEQIFFKYCSTFDSTAEGNIGPVADALAEALSVFDIKLEEEKTSSDGEDETTDDAPKKDITSGQKRKLRKSKDEKGRGHRRDR